MACSPIKMIPIRPSLRAPDQHQEIFQQEYFFRRATMRIQPQIDLSAFQSENSDFAHLSLPDLMTARDLFHVYLMRHPNVAATAIGRYRIRVGDSWPNDKKKIHGTSV